MVRRLFIAGIMFGMSCGVFAEESAATGKTEKAEPTLGMDFVTGYIWRGQKAGGVSLQPTAAVSWKGLSLGAWGSFALAPNQELRSTEEEIDITAGYTFKKFHIGITDYYFFNSGKPFFQYTNDNTAHVFEANIGVDLGFLSVDWFTNFAGNDGHTRTGKRAYSSYVLIEAPFKLARLDWTASLGAVPYSTDFYAADNSYKFHINQAALKAKYDIKLTHFTLPVFAQAIANPSGKNFFFVGGFGLKVF